MPVRALITGVGGFVGSHLADLLVGRGDVEVHGVLRRTSEHLAHLESRLLLRRGDVLDLAFIEECVRATRPEFVVHLAAQTSVGDSWSDPRGSLMTNGVGQINVLEAVARHAPAARVLVVGSAEEYGLVRPDDLPVTEATPLRPLSPYAVSKVTQDFLGLQYHLARGLAVIRVRAFNTIGPRQGDRFVVPSFARQVAEVEAGREPPTIRVGNLEARRDFVDVRDAVRAYWMILRQGEAGAVYNVGSGRSRAVREALDAMLAETRRPVRVEVDAGRLRPNEVPDLFADASALRRATGWQPTIPFATTIVETLAYWRQRVGGGAAGALARVE